MNMVMTFHSGSVYFFNWELLFISEEFNIKDCMISHIKGSIFSLSHES